MRTPFIAANWKMHKTVHESVVFVKEFRSLVKDIADVEIVIAPPFTAIHAVAEAARNSNIGVAGQNLYWERQGAFTPDTICDGLRTLIGAPNFELLRAAGAEVIVVDDAATLAAMRLLWDVLKQVVEPSSATVLAAVLAQPQCFAGLRVGLVLSGGNVDLPALRWGAA